MPEMIDRISYLSQEIGPRPAGTEEEQQAANYIADSFENEIGLPATIQEFNAPSDAGTVRAILAGAMVVASVLALLVKMIAVPLFVLLVVVAAVFFLEETGRPLLSRFLARGVSQNVVAKYVPEEYDGRPRRRKVILVARYDSGKVCPELAYPFVRILPWINKASAWMMFFVPVLILLRLTLFAQAEGILLIILNMVTVIALLLAAVPLILKVMRRFSAYNEAANSNASGVAVMMEAARRMASGTAVKPEKKDDDFDFEPVVHGEEAAREQGVAPEGATVTYDVSPTVSADPAAEVLESEITAEAAGVGTAVMAATSAAAAAVITEVAKTPEVEAPASSAPVLEEQDSVPAWFKSAQEKAKAKTKTQKSAGDSEIRRSRFADALDAAAGRTASAVADEGEKLESSIPYAPAPAEEVAAAQEDACSMEDNAALDANPFAAYAAQASAAAVQVEDEQLFESVSIPEPEPMPGTVSPADQMEDFNASLNQINPDLNVSIPSFLDPAKAQRQALDQRSERAEERSAVSADQDMAEALAVDATQSAPLSAADIAPVMGAAAAAPAAAARPKITLPSLSGEISAIRDRGGLLSSLPAVNVTPDAKKAAAPRPSVKDLRTTLPSLSGEISRIKGQVASLTGPLQPVEDVYAQAQKSQEELREEPKAQVELDAVPIQSADQTVGMNMAEAFDDVYEDDPYADLVADDDSEENVVDHAHKEKKGGFLSNLFGRFGRKSTSESASFDQEEEVWLDDEESDPYEPADRTWKGGAFSLKDKLQGVLPHKGGKDVEQTPRRSRRHGATEDVYALAPEELDDQTLDENVDDSAAVQDTPSADATVAEGQVQEIRDFHNPYIGTEVWFVALGAELADNAGMNAFIAEYGSSLRGSIIIELDSLGAGELSFVESGGTLRKVKSSSRMKRYLRRASSISGASVKTVASSVVPSTTVFANSHRMIAMHVCGMENGKPALLGQADDVVENVNQDMLYESADFVMDLVSVV